LPFPAVGRLLHDCLKATGLPHFGLLLGRHFDLSMLGALGFVMRNAPSVRSALRVLVLHRHLDDRGGAIGLADIDTRRVALSYVVFVPETPALGALYDAALMIGYRILKVLCGPRWRPLELRLARTAPADASFYRQAFEAPVSFNAPQSILIFESRWLDATIPGADPELYRTLARLMNELELRSNGNLTDRIRRALGTSVLAGTANAAHIAELFSLSQRSLRRYLTREGVTLKQLINEARMVVACQLLEQTRMPLGDIAAALHYADPTALSRAFRRWSGQSPTAWRSARRPGKAPD
jgi:AraC-like DNA-binding protein